MDLFEIAKTIGSAAGIAALITATFYALYGKYSRMKHVCTNCHFFAKEYREPNTGRPLVWDVSKDERDKANKGDTNFIGGMYSLKCHMGVWDEGLTPDPTDKLIA